MTIKKFRWSNVYSLAAIFLVVVLVLSVSSSRPASAAQLTTRSLTLQAGVTDGGSKPGGVVNHYFQFTTGSTNSIGSILFSYCTTPSGSCTVPTGMDTVSAGITLDQTGSGASGFTLVNTTEPNGSPYITRVAANINSGVGLKFKLLAVTNPDNTNCFSGTTPQSNNCTFYVRISTFTSTDATTGLHDTGVVAASTATPIVLSGYMPESLVFCTGGSVSTTSSVPDCSTATSGIITLPDFSPTATSFTTSQMAASTNAGSGYVITVNGVTLTSGGNTVTAATTNSNGDLSVNGTGQFGLNLKDNATPNIGTEIAPASNGTNYRGQATTGYNSADRYRFVTGENVADSANGGAGGTDAQIFTIAYIVNVPGSQPAGTYTTTLTYICTPTF